MIMTNTVYIGCSIDGFIARKDGSVDFLDNVDPPPEGEDYGWNDFFGPLDALVMGRNTYDVVLDFKVWHYNKKKVMVLTNREIEIPDFIKGDVFPFKGTPQEAIKHLANLGCKNLYIDGGKVIQDFLNANLVDRMVITYVPILIGDGIRLFDNLKIEQKFKLEKVSHFETGLVSLDYRLKK